MELLRERLKSQPARRSFKDVLDRGNQHNILFYQSKFLDDLRILSCLKEKMLEEKDTINDKEDFNPQSFEILFVLWQLIICTWNNLM